VPPLDKENFKIIDDGVLRMIGQSSCSRNLEEKVQLI
jgi:chromosome segregation ATPase